MPIDLYVGGAEHAVLHLLYARFWHKVMYDRGHVSTPEPFQRLVNQGMILGSPQFHLSEEAYEAGRDALAANGFTAERTENDDRVSYILKNADDCSDPADDAMEKRKGQVFVAGTDIVVTPKADKMSKARGNVVNPDDIVRDHGADTLRMYEMFMGPLEATKPWNMSGVGGVRKFLDRAWRMIVDESAEEPQLVAEIGDAPCNDEQKRQLHQTIKAITADTDTLGFNTAIARMMEFVNFFSKQESRPREAMEAFTLMLAPYAPHIAEELWQILGHGETLTYEPWPEFDESALVESTIELPVQVQGKFKAKISVPADSSQDDILSIALAEAKVTSAIGDKQIVKKIVVPGRMVNFVVK